MFALRGEKAKAFNKTLKGFPVETKAKELQVFLSFWLRSFTRWLETILDVCVYQIVKIERQTASEFCKKNIDIFYVLECKTIETQNSNGSGTRKQLAYIRTGCLLDNLLS